MTATEEKLDLVLEVLRALLAHLRDHRDGIVNSYPNKAYELKQIERLEQLLEPK